MFLNSNTSLPMYLFCNSRIYVITLYSGHVCVYYALMLRCWHLVWILARTDHPWLGWDITRRNSNTVCALQNSPTGLTKNHKNPKNWSVFGIKFNFWNMKKKIVNRAVFWFIALFFWFIAMFFWFIIRFFSLSLSFFYHPIFPVSRFSKFLKIWFFLI
jgi:hypothetical protein